MMLLWLATAPFGAPASVDHADQRLLEPLTTDTRLASGRGQVCMHGKAVPTWINIGVAKGGTTTLDAIASAAGAAQFAGEKEAGAFIYDPTTTKLADRSTFACEPDTPTLYDMTPKYQNDIELPGVLRQLYASDAGSLCITTLLREPIARMQSHMFFGPQSPDVTAVKDRAEADYGSLLERMPEGTYDVITGNYSRIPFQTQMGLYGYQMKQWLQEVNTDHVVVMPMMWAMENQVEAVELINAQCPHLKLNTSAVADVAPLFSNAANNNQPAEGLVYSEKLVQDFRRTVFNEDEEVLAQVLSEHTPSIAIGGLTPGAHHGAEEIRAHMRRYWGAKDY